MNINKLFEIQRELDNKILDRFPYLKNEDLLPKKTLALQVELGELANEHRGFKFWSEDQEPRVKAREYIPNHGIAFKWKNPLLEEYVDCLHFILSIGLELNVEDYVDDSDFNLYLYESLQDNTKIFNLIYRQIGLVEEYKNDFKYRGLWSLLMVLGNRLGFTWEQIEQAYLDKNKVNHARQESGY